MLRHEKGLVLLRGELITRSSPPSLPLPPLPLPPSSPHFIPLSSLPHLALLATSPTSSPPPPSPPPPHSTPPLTSLTPPSLNSHPLSHSHPRLTRPLPHSLTHPPHSPPRGYIHHLCDEINDTLQEVGQMSITDLSTSFGLPMDFILEVRPHDQGFQTPFFTCPPSCSPQHVESALGTRIKGRLDKVDSGIIYTEAYVARWAPPTSVP